MNKYQADQRALAGIGCMIVQEVIGNRAFLCNTRGLDESKQEH